MKIKEVKVVQISILTILLCFMVLLQSCGNSSSTPLASPLYMPKIYLTDTFNGRIVRMGDMSGNYSYWAAFSGFVNPKGLSLDSAGRIYVSDTGNNRIVRMDDFTGTHWTVFGTTGTNQFSNPSGMSVDSAGNIYVSDTGNNRIVKIDSTGTWTVFGTSGANQYTAPSGIYVDAAGKIYVTDTGNNRVVRMDNMNGVNWITFTGLLHPSGVCVDSSGKIFVSDSGNNRIVQINSQMVLSASFGTIGGGVGQFSKPTGIFVDPSGKIYISDSGNNRIVRIDDMTGANWVSVGGYGAGVYQFNDPSFVLFQ